MKSLTQFAKTRLHEHQITINQSLDTYLAEVFGKGAKEYHDAVGYAIDVYKDIVTRTAKRLRGSFVIEAYRMFTGNVLPDVIQAAVAIELIHAYLLVIDDFNDKSDLRRGEPTAHRLHERYHKEKLSLGDSLHYGYSTATLSGLAGMHHAGNLLLGLHFPPKTLLRALHGINDAINVTAYGQIRDIYNQQILTVSEADVLEVHRLKTAHYTYFNPIQLGAVLADQSEETIQKFTTYTKQAGIAFQIQDDILGVYGDPHDTGKSNKDDIMEGKATLLSVYALQHGSDLQKKTLRAALGNRELSDSDFEAIQQILVETGSLQHSKEVAHHLVVKAKESLYREFPDYTESEGFKFIAGVADYMIERKL
ncbi:MAG: polyprenyl synthetase family protein [Candidatus Dojkabacteria bacterium]|nr:MAG: polyprenyl synthetase family protein [Candidatus Dojkabacteria bacterium]